MKKRRQDKKRRPSRPPSARHEQTSGPKKTPRTSVVGRVQAMTLGSSSCQVLAGSTRYKVGAAVPGDTIRMEPLRSVGDPIPARLVGIEEPSADRVSPVCTLLGRCGGCTFQAMQYQAQLEAKHRALRRALEPLCEGELVAAPKGLANPFGYRTRLMMQAAPRHNKGSKGFRLGFFERGTTSLVETGGCPVQHPLTLASLAMAKQVLAHTPISASDHRSKRGWFHGLCVRVDPQTSATEITLIGRDRKLPGLETAARRLAALPNVSGVHLSINPERTSYLYGDHFVHLAGASRTPFNLRGETFMLSPGAFFQTCAEGAELLAETVLDFLPPKMLAMADLYGGVGVFARLSADRWERAVVVESNNHAVDDLKTWLHHSGQRKLMVKHGPVEQLIDKVMESTPDVILLDPPRGGCHPKVVRALGKHQPPVIVYVACGIDALVRDGRTIIGHGYKVERVGAVDMFPHTPHLETVVKFVRA